MNKDAAETLAINAIAHIAGDEELKALLARDLDALASNGSIATLRARYG